MKNKLSEILTYSHKLENENPQETAYWHLNKLRYKLEEELKKVKENELLHSVSSSSSITETEEYKKGWDDGIAFQKQWEENDY